MRKSVKEAVRADPVLAVKEAVRADPVLASDHIQLQQD